mmetsp:Transcript_206/g.592  ORF Transcript_206/g.592 Transcript_206/m.592 type:complete len:202 (-) Transcript_206:244-849(-)
MHAPLPRPSHHPRHTSHEPLVDHGIRHLDKCGQVGTADVIHGPVLALSVLDALRVDGLHDGEQAQVHVLRVPLEAQGVLGHLQARGGHAAGVGRLGGPKQDARGAEHLHRLWRAGHVGALGDGHAPAIHEGLGLRGANLVLRGAREGEVAGDRPGPLALEEIHAGKLPGNVLNPAALHVLEVLDPGELLLVEARGVVDGAA